MQRKIKNSEVIFIEESLVDLQVQLDNIKTYLDSTPWVNIEDEVKREKEFKFQSSLYDKYAGWLQKFMELSGIIDFYNESNKKKEDTLRKGYKENHLMQTLIKGELGVEGHGEDE